MILMIFCITVSIHWPLPVVEKWLIHVKRLVAAPALLVLSRALWFTMRLLRSRWWGNRHSRYRGITVFTRQYLCIWACNCKNSQWINLNIYRLTVYLQLEWRKKFFYGTKSKWPYIKMAGWFFWLVPKLRNVHGLTKITVCEP